MLNSGCPCTQSLRESPLPGLWIRVGCAWANTQGLQSPYFFSLKLHSSPPDSCLPWVPLPAEVPRRLHTQEGGFSWGPQHQRAGYLVPFPCILWIQDILYPESVSRVRPPLLGFARESGSSQRKPDSTGWRGASVQGAPHGCVGPTPVQPWDWVYSGSREGIASHRGRRA